MALSVVKTWKIKTNKMWKICGRLQKVFVKQMLLKLWTKSAKEAEKSNETDKLADEVSKSLEVRSSDSQSQRAKNKSCDPVSRVLPETEKGL